MGRQAGEGWGQLPCCSAWHKKNPRSWNNKNRERGWQGRNECLTAVCLSCLLSNHACCPTNQFQLSSQLNQSGIWGLAPTTTHTQPGTHPNNSSLLPSPKPGNHLAHLTKKSGWQVNLTHPTTGAGTVGAYNNQCCFCL